MQLRMIAISLGIVATNWFSALPSMLYFLVLFPLIWLWIRHHNKLLGILVCILLGCAWGTSYGYIVLSQQLPLEFEGADIWIDGEVVGLPEMFLQRGQPVQRFDLLLTKPFCGHSGSANKCVPIKKLRLKWYGQKELKPGQHWQLLVRAKRGHGFANPGGFDYQTWLVQHQYGGVGYVRDDPNNQQTADNHFSIDRLRWEIARSITDSLTGVTHTGVVKALLVGDKRGISSQQWQLFANTGTIHLMIISGLHIGLICGLVYLLVRTLSLVIYPRAPAERVAAVIAFIAAVAYSLAAGFTLPTQRALVMICVWLLAIFFKRSLAPAQGLVIAVLLCLVFDPLAPSGFSFWLSFAAVTVIFYGSAGRHQAGHTGRWFHGNTVQLLVFIGLIPVLAILFGRVSLLSPIANFVAVPVFSLLLVPVTLLTGLATLVSSNLTQPIWLGLDQVMTYVIDYLQWLNNSEFKGILLVPGLPWVVKILMVLGTLLILLPRGFPCRCAGWVLFLPALIVKPVSPAPGDLQLSILDVGQGLSIVVQTHHHVMVYDLGPSYGKDFSTAKAVVLPYLQQQGINRIDQLVLSHGDNDHAGDWQTFLTNIAVSSVHYGGSIEGLGNRASRCKKGLAWQWDVVDFKYLHPKSGLVSSKVNNHSCVLKITAAGVSFLLPGDIERSIEKSLLANSRHQLYAQVLVAPHHGSATSSTQSFIKQVNPLHVVFSSGYRNQFGHPRADVVARYQQIDANIHQTSDAGAILFKVINGQLLTPTHFREHKRRYWL